MKRAAAFGVRLKISPVFGSKTGFANRFNLVATSRKKRPGARVKRENETGV